MADVDDTLPEWSSTTASNKPTGATTIGTGLDDNLREVQGVVTRWLSHKGADIASAATTDLGAIDGLMHDITGTATITGFGTIRSGIWKVCKFEGAALLTHNATSLILPGAANIVTADGDVGIFMSEGSGNWRCLSYVKAAGGVLGPLLTAESATTSGATVTIGSIPPWAKKITVMLIGVSTSGTSPIIIQLGDAGGAENTGYVGSFSLLGTASIATEAMDTAGFSVNNASVAAATYSGVLSLTLQDSANFTWIGVGEFFSGTGGSILKSVGYKPLSAVLTQVVLTTEGGTDTFDAGAMSVLYE